eukprot:TRINITY_DN5208_c0_g1_i1.p1 TRINITY_DN5208_c0_g1~~TRINITY_DN5208_c0_g1_i1.p1  ORF type:complete len:256 (+),score=50.98 TRINITY_DN5208_c0_g1_i1:90-857(+)
MAKIHSGPDSRSRLVSDVSKQQPRALDQKPPNKDTAGFENTVMCVFFAKGLCNRGPECTFAHDVSQVREKPDLSRTSLCRQFMKKGLCKNADTCKYAHGKQQLRSKELSRTSRSTKVNCEQPQQEVPAPQSTVCHYAWDPLGLKQRPERLSDSVELPSLIWLMKALVVRGSSHEAASNSKSGFAKKNELDRTGLKLPELLDRRHSYDSQQGVGDDSAAPMCVKNTFLEFEIESPRADMFIRACSGPARLGPLETS